MSDSADFAPLGDMEIENAGSIFAQCEFVRSVASNAGLIVVQWAMDVEMAMASVPMLAPDYAWHGGADNPQKRARRVARHAFRAGEALRTTAESAAKIRPAYLKAFNEEIRTRRKRPTFDPRAGL